MILNLRFIFYMEKLIKSAYVLATFKIPSFSFLHSVRLCSEVVVQKEYILLLLQALLPLKEDSGSK